MQKTLDRTKQIYAYKDGHAYDITLDARNMSLIPNRIWTEESHGVLPNFSFFVNDCEFYLVCCYSK